MQCAYCCADKCECSNGVDFGQAGGVDVRLDLPIVGQHRLEDNLVTEKSMTDLQPDE